MLLISELFIDVRLICRLYRGSIMMHIFILDADYLGGPEDADE
jgi:hypothetical protein